MSSGRVASLSEAELKQITDGKDAKSTNNSTKYAVKTFRTYLKDKQLPEDFENWTKQELDSLLRCFYAEVMNTHGEMYKRTSLLSIRSSIMRHLSKTSSIDIIKDNEFNSSNDMFSSMCKFTVKEGKGVVVYKDDIDHSDIRKLYISMVFSMVTPTGLLNKVWFELCLHFCRRGRENQREYKPEMFALESDNLGKRYIQLTKLVLMSQKTTKGYRQLTQMAKQCACMTPGLIIVQLKVFSNICQSTILSAKSFFRDRRTLSMKMMKLGMRSGPLGKTSWEA
jgi:hypothetical protein